LAYLKTLSEIAHPFGMGPKSLPHPMHHEGCMAVLNLIPPMPGFRVSLSRRGRGRRYLFPFFQSLLFKDRLHPSDVPFDLRDSHDVLQLTCGMLKAKVKESLTQFLFLFEQLPLAQLAKFLYLHRWLPLMMNLV